MMYWPSLAPLLARGDLTELHARGAEQLELTREHPEWGLRDWGWTVHAGALWELSRAEMYDGSLARARELIDRGLEAARSVGDPIFEGSFSCWISIVACRAGEPEQGVAQAQRYVEFTERQLFSFRPMAYAQLADSLRRSGSIPAAIDAIEQAVSLHVTDQFQDLIVGRVRARVRLANGAIEAGLADAERVFARALEVGARIEAAESAIAVSEILRVQADPAGLARIEELLATAERLIAETGARNLTPLLLLERVARLTRDEDAPRRRELLERALAEFTRMEATGHMREVAKMLEAEAK